MYLGAARLLGLEPGQVMMVAAHGGDLQAAAALGLRTAFVRRPYERGPDGAPEPEPEGQLDYRVNSFLELADALRA
jgi:2-haloacid dehalogenase